MEGSYSRVWQLCSNPQSLPRPEFEFFVSTLVGMVRNEIASCQERSYATLPLSNARTLLFFSEEKEVKEFAIAVGLFFRFDGFACTHNGKTNFHIMLDVTREDGIWRDRLFISLPHLY
jgi:hypothetical protein